MTAFHSLGTFILRSLNSKTGAHIKKKEEKQITAQCCCCCCFFLHHCAMDALHDKTKNMSTCKSIGSNGATIPPSLSSSLLEQYDTLIAKSYSFCHFLRNETHKRTHSQCECGREKKMRRRWWGEWSGVGDGEQHSQSTDKLQHISRENGAKNGSTMAIGAPEIRQ